LKIARPWTHVLRHPGASLDYHRVLADRRCCQAPLVDPTRQV